MSVRALRDLEHGRARAAQRRSAEILADALALRGTDREEFLRAARDARRRAPDAVDVAAWLPPPVELVGREDEVARLRELAAGEGGTVVVVGPPGVGKTALAVFVAHELRPVFPDGTVLVDLRGTDDHPLPVGTALEWLLRGLRVPESDIPASVPDRIGLYRATLARRRVLVLLDNVADEAQVRPLLVGSAGCLTMVTCRRALAGLEGARWEWLQPLTAVRSVELVARIIGDDRMRREPEAAAELAALCGNLPLAVRIASNRLASRPHWSLAYLVEQLRDERVRLNALSVGDLQVRSAFEISYRRLSPGARLVFRRLAGVPGRDFSAELAEVVTGLPWANVVPTLDEVVDAGMLQATHTDGRFRYHDLLRIFATERWQAEDSPADQARVSEATLGHLLSSACAAGSMYLPEEDQPANLARVFGSAAEAGEWLVREESNWVAALWVAADRGWHREVLDLARIILRYADVAWTGLPWVAIFERGVAAARALGDQPAEAMVLNHLAWAHGRVHGDEQRRLAVHKQALAVAEQAGDLREQAWACCYIGGSFRLSGDLDQALPYAQRAAAISASCDSWAQQAEIRFYLGKVYEAAGRYDEALSVHRAVLAEAEEYSGADRVAWRHTAACVTVGIGSALSNKGDWRLAAETFYRARGMYLDAGSPANAGDAALKEGRAWLDGREYTLARECFYDALTLYGSTVPQRLEAQVHAELARLPAD